MEVIAKKLKPDRAPGRKMTSLSSCWELLYHIEKDNIKTKQDIIVLMVHLVMIKNDFVCIHEEVDNKPVKTSELLPEGWNSTACSNNFKLRYLQDSTKYHLGANLVDDIFAINLLNLETQATQSIVVMADNDVKELQGTLVSMVPTHKELLCKIWTDLVKPATSGGQKDTDVQTEVRPRSPEEPILGIWPLSRGDPFPHAFDPLGVGSRDLNPFAPIGPGSGMLLENPIGRIPMPDRDLPGPGGILPRGSIPPGARFDPFHPILPGRRPGPDPDHLPMPGRFDDMFM